MENRYTETHTTWNKIAQLYEDKFMELELYTDTYVRFCDLLSKPDASVLEIGCGPGNITRHILNSKPKIKVLARARPTDNLVHNSDRGIQYISNQHVKQLNKHNIRISMTKENHCYENAVAERVYGILKGEFYLDECFTNTLKAKKAVKCAIDI